MKIMMRYDSAKRRKLIDNAKAMSQDSPKKWKTFRKVFAAIVIVPYLIKNGVSGITSLVVGILGAIASVFEFIDNKVSDLYSFFEERVFKVVLKLFRRGDV